MPKKQSSKPEKVKNNVNGSDDEPLMISSIDSNQDQYSDSSSSSKPDAPIPKTVKSIKKCPKTPEKPKKPKKKITFRVEESSDRSESEKSDS